MNLQFPSAASIILRWVIEIDIILAYGGQPSPHNQIYSSNQQTKLRRS